MRRGERVVVRVPGKTIGEGCGGGCQDQEARDHQHDRNPFRPVPFLMSVSSRAPSSASLPNVLGQESSAKRGEILYDYVRRRDLRQEGRS